MRTITYTIIFSGLLLAGVALALDPRFEQMKQESEALLRAGDHAGALRVLEDARATAAIMLGDAHPDVAELTARLARLHLYASNLDAAEEMASAALAARENSYGGLHPTVAASLLDLAGILLVQGRRAEAAVLYERLVDLWTELEGPDASRTRQARDNLADFYEAEGLPGAAQALREAASAMSAERVAVLPPAAPSCPVVPRALAPPPWNQHSADALFRVALKHEGRISHALRRTVHHFSRMPGRAQFETVFGVDADAAHALATRLREGLQRRDPSLLALFSLIYLSRERVTVAVLERVSPSPGTAPDFHAIAADVRRRMLVGVTRHELSRTPIYAGVVDDVEALLARREHIAKLMVATGFELNNEIKYRPSFLACVATTRLLEEFDYDALLTALKVIARNADALDAFLRFGGIDLDAGLKAYAREEPIGQQYTVEEVGSGVMLDRYNHVVFLEAHPETAVIHLGKSRRDRVADLAALVSQWEHGALPTVSWLQLDTLIRTAQRHVDDERFADTLEAVALDLRTRYPARRADGKMVDTDWSRPRVARWERSRVGQGGLHTYYDLQFDTRNSFAVPVTDFYVTKHLDSPVGMALAIGLHAADLPKRALEAFSRRTPTLHVTLAPDAGLAFELYAHPQRLTRQAGVEPLASGEIPLHPPPISGWEIAPVLDETSGGDHLLLDVRPVPGIEPGEPKAFSFHVCLLTPLDVLSDGRRVRFSSPIWHVRDDVPATARFVVYRRVAATPGDEWVEIADRPLSLTAGSNYPHASVTPLEARTRGGYLQLSFEDLTARPDGKYEYLVLHRCALKPYPDEPPGAPARSTARFEIVSVERSPRESLSCAVRKGYSGIARPWVKVTYRLRGRAANAQWRDEVSVLDPSGQDLARRGAVTMRREPRLGPTSPETGREYTLLASVAACTDGPYRFRIRLEGDGFAEEVAETLYVRVAPER